jgi:exodeoxyribonuclease VIII
MIDLETMGTKPNSAIVSYGAAAFDFKTGEVGPTIYRVIDLETTMKYPEFEIEPGTLYWWLQQSEPARMALIQEHNRESIEQAMKSLSTFLEGVGNPQRIRLWGNGPSFDNAMIRHTHKVVTGRDIPIPFWNDRCVRTVKGFYPNNLFNSWKMNNLSRGTYHNALDDAKYQIKFLCHIFKELGVEDLQ